METQIKQVFLDLDAVIADFAQGCIDHFKLSITPAALQSWDSIYDYVDMPIKDFWKSLDYDFWYNLKLTEEAQVILDILEEHQPTILTTAPYSSPGVFDAKAAWIKDHLPDYYYSGRFLIGGTKHQIAASDKLLIDDSQTNCEDWSEHGGYALLVPRPWNKCRGQSVLNAIRYGLDQFETWGEDL